MLRGAGLRAGADGPVAYLESDGVRQSGIAAVDGAVVAPFPAEDNAGSAPPEERALDRVLRRIGVRAQGAGDACAAVVLTRCLPGGAR